MIPNGVDLDHLRPGLTPKQPARLIFNGSLTYSANFNAMQYFLAEIYPLVKQRLPDVELDNHRFDKGCFDL